MSEAYFVDDVLLIRKDKSKVWKLMLECQACKGKYVLDGSLPIPCPHCGKVNIYP